jgi:hypothetical protein
MIVWSVIVIVITIIIVFGHQHRHRHHHHYHQFVVQTLSHFNVALPIEA